MEDYEELVPTNSRVVKRRPGRPRKHGVYAPSELAPLTDRKVKLIFEIMTGEQMLIAPQDEILIRLLAQNLAQIELITRYLQEHGIIADEVKGTVQPIYALQLRALDSAVKMLTQLGFTPASRAKLGSLWAQATDFGEAIQNAREEES